MFRYWILPGAEDYIYRFNPCREDTHGCCCQDSEEGGLHTCPDQRRVLIDWILQKVDSIDVANFAWTQISLELGGNAPLIIFNDADIEIAVKGAVSFLHFLMSSRRM
jgi:hypothetical protein